MFYVGMKVVCVDASDLDHVYLHPLGLLGSGGLDGLAEGQIYTVRAVTTGHGGVLCLCLHEIRRDIDHVLGKEAAYAARRFRPVVDRPTDISIFTRMLNPSDEQVGA